MRSVLLLTICIMVMLTVSQAFGAADGYYVLSSTTTYTWDGTDANRQKPATADYVSTYGDESSVTYTLPASFGSFPFYGQSYTQITADTNGNIWFGGSGSAHSFNLASNGRGPVIAAWNNDLSSYYYGGVFIQHKTDPERVVVAWQTETYTNEGRNLPNSFEAVLYPSGAFRLDYQSFAAATTNKDFGSGASKNDGSNYLSVTTGYGNVHTLAAKSYQFEPQSGPAALISLGFSGNGSGTVTSAPAGLLCTTDCNASFKTGTVTLSAVASFGSIFTGWTGGGCSTSSTCTINLTGPTSVTANFVGFTVSLSSPSAPALATFTDSSTNATSWSWDFGDGTTSTLKDPTHVYNSPGSYTVTHTATNSYGSASSSQNITLTACAGSPVKIGSNGYATLQAAYDSATSGALIQVLATGLTESLTAGRDVAVTVECGYLCGFPATPRDETVLNGLLNIFNGNVAMKDCHFKP